MPDKETETFKISVDNVSEGVEADTVREEFTKFGKILDIAGEAGTFAVTFESLEEAQDAIYQMDGKEFHGQDLNVELVEEDEAKMDTTEKENGDKNGHEKTEDKGTKIFVGNLGGDGKITNEDLRPLFEKYGKVTECECIGKGKYAFVHMEELQEATEAIENLNGQDVKGQEIKVEKAVAKQETTKIWVGNLESTITSDDLRPLFEKYGTVTECECMGKFAFVHMETESEATEAVKELNGHLIKDRNIKVEKGSLKDKRGGGGKMRGRGRGRGGPRNQSDPAPFLCFNPACEHVQQFGECKRYKTPCPSGPGPRGRGGRRGGGNFGGGFGGGYGGPPARSGPYGRGYGPPAPMYDPYGPPMYEPYNDYGPQMDPYYSRGGGGGGGNDGPPFMCYSPACQHFQNFGECVRYKSPCPNSGAGRGRGRGRGRARGGRA